MAFRLIACFSSSLQISLQLSHRIGLFRICFCTRDQGFFKSVHFSKKSGRLSSAAPEILAFGSHCSTKFQPILDCFIPNVKLEA